MSKCFPRNHGLNYSGKELREIKYLVQNGSSIEFIAIKMGRTPNAIKETILKIKYGVLLNDENQNLTARNIKL